jgi:hypothetical protein
MERNRARGRPSKFPDNILDFVDKNIREKEILQLNIANNPVLRPRYNEAVVKLKREILEQFNTDIEDVRSLKTLIYERRG